MVRERGHGDLTEGTLGLGAETDREARRAWCLALRGPKHILYHLWPCCNLLSSARPSFVRLCLSLALGTCRRNEHSFMLNVPDWKDRLQPEGSCRCWGGWGWGGCRNSKEPEPDPCSGNLPRQLGSKQVARESQTLRDSREVQLPRTRKRPMGTSEAQG